MTFREYGQGLILVFWALAVGFCVIFFFSVWTAAISIVVVGVLSPVNLTWLLPVAFVLSSADTFLFARLTGW
jgi:hypothetical protein